MILLLLRLRDSFISNTTYTLTKKGWQTSTQCSRTNTQIFREDSARPTHQHRAAIFHWLHLFFPWNVVGLELEIVSHLHLPPCQDPVLSQFFPFYSNDIFYGPVHLINPFLWRCGLPVTALVVGCNIASKHLYNICLKMLNNILFPRFDFKA